MEYREAGWSKSRWGLTAPESYVLIYGPKAGGSRPLKLALMELIAGKCLTLADAEDRILFGLWKRSVALLAPGPRHRSPGSRSLCALLDLLDGMSPHTTWDGETGVPIASFAREARRKYRLPGAYAELEVMPGLASRGFYERRKHLRTWKITRAGEEAQTELERNLEALGAKRLSLWVDDNPARALAYLGVAGSSVLLAEELNPGIQRLRERQQATGDMYLHPGHGGGAEGSPDLETDWPDAFDSLDLSTFDGLDGVFSAIDFGVGDGSGGTGGS